MTAALNIRECVRNLDLRVQVHPGELWISKQRVHIVLLEASKSAGAKGDVPKICGFPAFSFWAIRIKINATTYTKNPLGGAFLIIKLMVPINCYNHFSGHILIFQNSFNASKVHFWQKKLRTSYNKSLRWNWNLQNNWYPNFKTAFDSYYKWGTRCLLFGWRGLEALT